jgi:hypothetical protein
MEMTVAAAFVVLGWIPKSVYGVRFDLLVGAATITAITLTPFAVTLGEWIQKRRHNSL